MDESRYNQLLDLVYETIAEPGLWVPVMERIADAIGGNSGWLSQLSIADGSGSGLLARIDPEVPQRYLEYYGGLNPMINLPRPREYMAQWAPSITTHDDHLPREELLASEFYNDFLKPQDANHVLMIDLAGHGVEISTVNIHRAEAQGRFESADLEFAHALHPHLMRAFRLGGIRSELIGLNDGSAARHNGESCVFVLDMNGCVRHASRAGEALLGRCEGLTVANGKLVATEPRNARKLQALIGSALSTRANAKRGGAMMLAFADDRSPLSLTVAPLRSERLPIVSNGQSIVVRVKALHGETRLSDGQLRELFGLTAAECRVVRKLLEGVAPPQIAQHFGLSVHTVRSQLASIYGKTGTSGQISLARLLMHALSGTRN